MGFSPLCGAARANRPCPAPRSLLGPKALCDKVLGGFGELFIQKSLTHNFPEEGGGGRNRGPTVMSIDCDLTADSALGPLPRHPPGLSGALSSLHFATSLPTTLCLTSAFLLALRQESLSRRSISSNTITAAAQGPHWQEAGVKSQRANETQVL